MDGLFDDESRWLRLVDGADRIFHSISFPTPRLVLVCVYYIFLGSWLDLLLTGIILGLQHGQASTTFILYVLPSFRNVIVPVTIATALCLTILSVLDRQRTRWAGPGQPFLIPCKTTHTRLFPEQHSFTYSYLVAGVPVGTSGTFNGMLTIEGYRSGWFSRLLFNVFRRGWYSVNSDDYLQRGFEKHGLRGKLDAYLFSQGVDPSDYPHAYLVTAARFLGYHFNPVSFWYLYSPDRILSAIVLEVNNTFDERRPYLVLRDFSNEAELLTGLTSDPLRPPRVTGSWAKDFHVSPFNSRKGTYSLLANDPLGHGMRGFQGIDVNIRLKSSKGHPKLVARLFSHGEAVDPECLGSVAKARFIAVWFWVGFATFPRIVKEAALLFFKRKLHVWYRPEPSSRSIGRHATDIEQDLEVIFRSYLEFLVQKCPKPLALRYISSGITDKVDKTMSSPACNPQHEPIGVLELRVLTPLFYSRFTHYVDDLEAITTEMAENGTIWVNEPSFLSNFFAEKSPAPLRPKVTADHARFRMIRALRRRPPKIPRISTSADPPVGDIRASHAADSLPNSPLDAYISAHANHKLSASYRSAVLRLFIADRYLMGSVALVDSLLCLLQLGIAWLLADTLGKAAKNFDLSVLPI